MKRGGLSIAAAVAAALVGNSTRVYAQLAAFPGALGYGAATTGARADGTGLTVYHVTTLSDGTGVGTFRSAVSASNRIIVFDVGGNIDITSPISAKSNLTILGQTAPGQGIAIYGAETSFFGESNDIVRYVRFMDTTLDPKGQGTGNSSGNCINLGQTSNMIFDHVSCEFASYNNIDAATADNLTFSNSIVADPILAQDFNFHWEGTQGTFINNIFANSHNRSILAKGNTQFVNNTIYNYQAAFTANSGGAFKYDIVNNYFVTGPSKSNSGHDAFYQLSTTQSAYSVGNLLDNNNDGTLNGSSYNSTGCTVLAAPWSSTTTSLPTLSAAASYAWNTAHSGDSLTHDPSSYAPALAYDEVDGTVISNVNSMGTAGRLYNAEDDDGITDGPTAGVGPVAGGTIVNSNYSTLLNPEGYTEVEAWANSMSDSTFVPRIWTANGGEWNTTNNWGTTVPNATAVPGVYDIAYVEGNGAGADGSLTVSTTTPVAYQLFIGGNGGAAGEKVDVTAGTLNVQDTITVGYLNNATLQIDGGTARAANVQLGNTVGSTTYNGNLILNGGTLQTEQVVLGGGAPSAWTSGGSITFNGGTLQAIGSLNINAPAVINSSTAYIDTNGNSGTDSGAISGSGSLTKLGAGILSLTATNTFAGGLVLDAGELGISSNANIDGANSSVSFLGGLLQIQGTSLTSMGTHPFNTTTFNGGFDIVQATNTFTVGQTLSGAGSFTLTGAGALQLTASNGYSGGTNVNGGTLIVTADNNIGATGGTLSINGGTLEVLGTTYVNTTAHPLTGNFNGTIDVATSGAVFTIEQQVNGTGNLTKTGPGTLVLGTRDYLSGNAYLNGGTITIGDPLSLRYMTVNFNTAGSTVNLNGISGATIGAITGSQNFDMQGLNPAIENNNSSTTYSGVLSSSVVGGFYKIGTGTLTLTGSNTFTGTLTISSGILSVSTLNNGGSAGPLGAATNAQANIVLNGGTLQYTGAGGSTDHLFDIGANGGTLDASGTAAVAYVNTGVLSPTAAANVTLTLTGTNGNHNAFDPALADPAGVRTTSLTMSGTGLWDLEGNQKTYSGATTVVTGELQTLATNVMSPNSSVTVDSGATLDFHGYSQTINGLNGAGFVSDSFSHSTDSLTIGQSNGSGSFSGNLGCPNVIKAGTGTQVLSGSDSYTGATTVNSGVLQFNAADSIGGTGASVTVSTGATMAAGYAIVQAFLNRITPTSTGCAALALASANNLNFSSGSGDANLPNVSLGAVGAETYTGTLTPYGTTYLLGGGGGTLTLSSTNALTGSNNLQVVATGVVQLTSTNNLTGTTTISPGGILSVSTLANGGVASSIGATSNAATSIVLDGGTLRYTGAAVSTDRSFTLTANGGTLDGSGSAGIQFNSPNPVAFTGTGNQTLTLVGSESHSNFDMILGDPASGQTAVTVNTPSRWLWVSPFSSVTYSGNTNVLAGELELFGGSGGGQLPSGTGKGNVLVNTGGTLYITGNSGINGLSDGPGGGGTVTGSGGNLTLGNGNAGGTFSGQITGPIGLIKTGTGTQAIQGISNTFTGNATISGGTLNVAGALANAASITVDATKAPANLVLNGTNAISSSAPITALAGSFTPTITVNANQNLGSLTSAGTTNFTAGTSTVSSFGGAGTLLVGSGVRLNVGTLSQTGPINNSGTLNVTAGGTISTLDGTGSTSLTAAALNATYVRQGTLNIDANSTVTVAASGTSTATSVVTNLSNNGTINLKNNDLIVANDPGVGAQIATGYNSGGWNGLGIISTSALAHAGYNLGYATGAQLGTATFDGQPITGTAVVAKYTLSGDLNLDNSVDQNDIALLAPNYGTTSGATWYQGDVNHDGAVDQNDIALIAPNYGQVANAPGNALTHSVKSALVRSASPGLSSGGVAPALHLYTWDAALADPASGTVLIKVDNTTGDSHFGDVILQGNSATLYTLVITSASGSMNSARYSSLGTQYAGGGGSEASTMKGLAVDNTTQHTGSFSIFSQTTTKINEAGLGVTLDFTSNTESLDMSAVKNGKNLFSGISADLAFSWSGQNGTLVSGLVEYSTPTVTPEPGMLGMLGVGGVMMMRRRRKAR